jgi:hypothetical protein
VTIFLKFVHLATIAVWSGGLLVLPLLFWQRRLVTNIDELESLHRTTRFVYVVRRPAAFVAIASGTASFLQTTFREWFAEDGAGRRWRCCTLAGLTAVKVFALAGRFGRGLSR